MSELQEIIKMCQSGDPAFFKAANTRAGSQGYAQMYLNSEKENVHAEFDGSSLHILFVNEEPSFISLLEEDVRSTSLFVTMGLLDKAGMLVPATPVLACYGGVISATKPTLDYVVGPHNASLDVLTGFIAAIALLPAALKCIADLSEHWQGIDVGMQQYATNLYAERNDIPVHKGSQALEAALQ